MKRNLKYRVHVCFKLICTNIIYQALAYLKSHNELYDDISIRNGLLSKDMFKFFDGVDIEGLNESVTEKIVLNGKETSENINDTKAEI